MKAVRSTSLRTRVLFGSALLVVLPVAAALIAVTLVGERLATRSLEESVARGQAVQAHFQQWRARQLALISRVFTSDRAFASYLAEARARAETGGAVDSLSIADLLAERQADLGFDFALALDGDGRVLARTGPPAASDASLASDPLVRRALDELVPVTGVWRVRDRLHQVAIVPVEQDFQLIGFVVTGLAITDALATEMGRIGALDVAFLAPGTDGQLEMLASSLDLARAGALRSALGTESVRVADVLGGRANAQFVELGLAGRRVLARLDAVADAGGRPIGLLVSLGSAEAQADAFRTLRLAVVVAGVGAVALALGLAYLLTRRALRPVEQLALAAEAAASGDYSRRLGSTGDRELDGMARAFNSLLRNLRERREMESYVSDIQRNLPEGDGIARTVPRGLVDEKTASVLLPTRPAGQPSGTAWDAADPDADVLPSGSVIDGRYEIRGLLGSGGMGVAYAAQDQELGELVAIKLLRPAMLADRRLLEMLKDEIRLARKITHPNVLRTHDYGEHEGMPYISMEIVRGLTLRRLLRQRGALPLAPAVFVLRQACDGLAAAHEMGVLHRDIKPENIMIDRHGHAKLMDFGIAMAFRDAGDDRDRRSAMGTPLYMAPEVLEGAIPDVRADLYSVGVMAYELFTGRPPFGYDTLEQLLGDKRAPFPAPSERNASVPAEVDGIVMRCLDPNPERRFRTASELRQALDAIAI